MAAKEDCRTLTKITCIAVHHVGQGRNRQQETKKGGNKMQRKKRSRKKGVRIVGEREKGAICAVRDHLGLCRPQGG